VSVSPRLSSQQVAALLDELVAMFRSERPLATGLRTLEDTRLGQLGRAASQLRSDLEAGRSLADSLSGLNQQSGPQASAAFRIAIESGNSDALRELADLLRRRRAMTAASLIALIYPMIVLLIGYLVLTVVFSRLVQFWSTEATFRWAQPLANGLATYWAVPPLLAIGLLLMLAIYAALKRDSRSSEYLPGRSGRLSLFCSSLAMQIDGGVPVQAALPLAADISGERSIARLVPAWITATAAGETASVFVDAPPMLRFLLSQIHDIGEAAEALPHQLRSLSHWYQSQQDRQHQFWIRWLPSTIVCCVGVLCAAVYIYTILWPMYGRLGAMS